MSRHLQDIRPKLSEPFPIPIRYWTDPKTGLVIPKRPEENLAWRMELLEKAEKDDSYDVAKFAIEISADTLYSRTFTIDHQ